MAAGTNIKVGITVTVFTVVLTAVLLWFSQFNPGKSTYELKGLFTNVGGMLEGSKVYLMGVKVGVVKALIPEANRVNVIMAIDSGVKIPTNTRLAITAKGLVGDKTVEFFIQNDQPVTSYYEPGQVINGNSPASFEDLIVEAKKAMIKAQNLISDPEMNRNIKLTTRNVETFTRNLNGVVKQINSVAGNLQGLSKTANGFVTNSNNAVDDINLFVNDLRGIANANRSNINNIIHNTGLISRNLERTAHDLNDILENPENRKDLKLAVKSIRNAVDNLQHISTQASRLVDNAELISYDIRDVSGDTDLKNNLKDIIKNTKTISGAFANTLTAGQQKDQDKDKETDKKKRLNVEFKNEILAQTEYQFKQNAATTFDIVGNFNILAHTGFERFPFINLGVEQIGSGNLFNLQAGFYPFENLRLRLGIVRGKLGVGTNYFFEPTKTEIIAETYDISSPHIRLGVLQNIYQDYGLSLYWDNHFSTNLNMFNLGVRWQPSLF